MKRISQAVVRRDSGLGRIFQAITLVDILDTENPVAGWGGEKEMRGGEGSFEFLVLSFELRYGWLELRGAAGKDT